MNKGLISVIMPRPEHNQELAAIRQLEAVAKRLIVPPAITYRSGCIWGIRSGPIEARHEDFAECATEFIKKTGIQL
jgi:hypothetical protein